MSLIKYGAMYVNRGLDKVFQDKPESYYDINFKHHIIFWSIYFVFNTLRWDGFYHDFLYALKSNLLGFPIHICLVYLNIYYLMPRYIFTKRYWTYAAYIMLFLFLALLLKFNLTYYFLNQDVMPEIDEVVDTITLNYAIVTMLGEVYVMGFVTAIKVTIDWLREHNKLHELEKRQLTTELRFLRSQVSPHFFFNTLNNIYSLSLQKSSRAPVVILKLSEFMRYLLYATQKSKQNLTNEIECIQNYIDLERIRFGDSLFINFNISGNLEDKQIAPMLLIPLVENCFKHGANAGIEPVSIDIDLDVQGNFMNFTVVNTIPKQTKKNLLSGNYGGIGLSNVKKRLELGYNKTDYNLSTFKKDGKFHVILKLKVNDETQGDNH